MCLEMRLAVLPEDISCDTDNGSISKSLFHLTTDDCVKACVRSFKTKSLWPSLNTLASGLFIVSCDTDDRECVLHTAPGPFVYLSK